MKHFNTAKNLALWLTIVLSVVFAFYTLYLPSYGLHQVGTVLMLMVLLYFNAKFFLTNASFILYCLFLYLHIFAACWLYSFVPYNDWLINYLNFDLNQYFNWQRNMFDRLIHFCYGLLLYPFFYQVARYYFGQLSSKQLHVVVLLWVMASSMLYELIEWGIALALSPESAEHYNGQQGDMWDAHKDMFLATLGSLLMGGLTIRKP